MDTTKSFAVLEGLLVEVRVLPLFAVYRECHHKYKKCT